MVSVEELYELWAEDSELAETLQLSLDPRGTDWLFALFAELGPGPGETLVDVGCRDGKHAIRLGREHRLRTVAVDPLRRHVELSRHEVEQAGADVDVLQGAIESLPLPDASADWIWCRDVLVHTDARRGLAECARVLRPAGRMVAYMTLATELLEPRERELLVSAVALVSESLDAAHVEAAAAAAGLEQVAVHRLAGEWRERMIEDGSWNPSEGLLGLSRLQRRERELAQRFCKTALAAYTGGQLWGIYQLIGKLCPTVYVWQRG